MYIRLIANCPFTIILVLLTSLTLTSCGVQSVVNAPNSTRIENAEDQLEIDHTSGIADTVDTHYSFDFNFYTITSEYQIFYGSDFIDFYNHFIDAYLNYENTCYCPSAEYAYLLSSMISTCFPLFTSDGMFDYDHLYSESDHTISIFYSSDLKQHRVLIENFKARITSIIEENIQAGDSDLFMALAIYRALSSSFYYDYEAANDESAIIDISPYRAIMEHGGICQSFAGAYCYFMLQLGIDANTCSGLAYDLSSSHTWNILRIDNKYYYVDPTYENTDTGGFGLLYFGITQTEREEDGYDSQYNSIGVTNHSFPSNYSAQDLRFSCFRSCYSFILDRKHKMVNCYNQQGKQYHILK